MASATAADPTGFGVVVHGRDVALSLYGAGATGRVSLLSVCDDGLLQSALVGRLYYRDDGATTSGDKAASRRHDDAAFALHTYRRLGVAGLERLEGEFALVVVDRAAGRVVALRDPLGGYPIYWYKRGETLAVATLLRPIVDLVPDVAVDIGFLAEIQTLPFAEIDYFPGTPFVGVQRLVSGSRLSADLAKGNTEIRRYWNWAEHVVDPGTDDVAAIGERYADLLRSAVRERARGTVAAQLSGGMDSTSVALLARDALAPGGGSVHALSLVYERLDRLTEERPFLESALDQPGIIPHRILADGILDFDIFADQTPHDEPYTGFYRSGMDVRMIEVAADAGCDTILTGNGADEVLDTAPFYIADLVRSGKLVQAWSESARWARAYNGSPWRVLNPFGIAPLLPASIRGGLKPLLRRGHAPWNEQNHATIPPWILPDFAAQGQLQARYRHQMRSRFPAADTLVLSDVFGRLRVSSGDWVRYNLAAPRNIHIAHPFRDPRVLSFGLGARQRIRPTPLEQKAVLAHAMRHVLPQTIVRRPNKVHFNAVYYQGLARNLPMLEGLVRDSDCEDRGLFNKDVLVRCLRDASLGYGRFDGKSGLDNSLTMIKWLALLPAWRKARLDATRVLRSTLADA